MTDDQKPQECSPPEDPATLPTWQRLGEPWLTLMFGDMPEAKHRPVGTEPSD